MKMQLAGISKNKVRVMYDPINSHAATHLDDTPQLKELVREAIGGLDLHGEEIKTQIDMGRIVGTSDVVTVDDSDEIVYGMRKNRAEDGLVPFTKSRAGTPCPFVALHLVPQSDGSYVLLSAWIGPFNAEEDEPFPGSSDATEGSKEFWSRRAFVYGSQEIVAGTETPVRPW